MGQNKRSDYKDLDCIPNLKLWRRTSARIEGSKSYRYIHDGPLGRTSSCVPDLVPLLFRPIWLL